MFLSLALSKLFWIKIVRKSKEKEVFTAIWHKIWLEEGYALSEEPIVEKYSKYNFASTDFLAKLLGIIPVGTLRIIRDSSLGLPVLNDFEIRKNPEGKVAEVTLFTVRKQFRASLATLVLMKAMYRYAKKENDGIVIASDRRLFLLLTRILGFPFRQIGPEKMYEGSMTYPAYLNFDEAEEVAKKKAPWLYMFFTK